MVSANKVFVARLVGCSVFDPVGDRVGKARDVLVVYRRNAAPRVIGLMVEIPGRRRVFVSSSKVTSIDPGQIITTGLINLRRFEQRGQEVRVMAEIVGRKVWLTDGSGEATIEDLAIERNDIGEWEIGQLFLRRPRTGSSPFGKGQTLFAHWSEIAERASSGEAQDASRLIESFADLKPADLANAMLELPEQRMLEVAEELGDDQLAAVLGEMPESDQVFIIDRLEQERAATVLNEMQPDDAADLIAGIPILKREVLLALMEPEEAEDLRRLLNYEQDTAGGLMTSEPVILPADATVAEAMAMIRRQEVPPALGAAVFATLPPYDAPTGRYLGLVHFQKMLRYPPHERLGALLDRTLEPVKASDSASEVARRLASYDLVSVPVVDDNYRLVGAVTVDDVLDYLLPDNWRSGEDDEVASGGTDRDVAAAKISGSIRKRVN